MGCDIHVFLEVKVKGKWILMNHPRVTRHYDLFEKMAGVRGEEHNAIVRPKGLPEDISQGTQLYYKRWEGDAHSMSWFTVDEMRQLKEWIEKQAYLQEFYYSDNFGYLFGNYIHSFNEYREDYPKEIQDVRVVFWFDN